MRLAMAQMLVEGGEPERNVTRAVERIEQAAAKGCDAVLLPECLDVGWTHSTARKLAQEIPGERSDALAAAARRHGVYVVAGLTERAGQTIHNAAILISPDGDILLKHRKINLLDIARDLYSPGEMLGVADTAFGKVGIPICADNFPDTLELARSLTRMGANLILSPCAWAVTPDFDNEKTPYGDLWMDAYGTLTKERHVSVVGVSNVGRMTGGPWEGHSCIGSSLAVGPGGETLARLPFGEDADSLEVIEI